MFGPFIRSHVKPSSRMEGRRGLQGIGELEESVRAIGVEE